MLQGCKVWQAPTYQTITWNQAFSLEIPDYLQAVDTLKEERRLNPDGIFQYENQERDLFLILRRDSLASLHLRQPDFDLKDFYDVTIEHLVNSLTGASAPPPDSMGINAMPAYVGDLSGILEGDMLFYRLALAEGREYVYQILVWTTEEKRPMYEEDMNRLLFSFKENPGLLMTE